MTADDYFHGLLTGILLGYVEVLKNFNKYPVPSNVVFTTVRLKPVQPRPAKVLQRRRKPLKLTDRGRWILEGKWRNDNH